MKPGLPQGTRDFDAATIRKRNYIFDTIKRVFELYGFEPLETPAFENLETLTGKYGEEGDKLIFKILNNGLENPAKRSLVADGVEKLLSGKNSKEITERALRYDLTIPFARYVAMNHSQLTFPFKRYQMQPVWRADRPQRGRYREFYQCDADVVGSYSLNNDASFLTLYSEVFKKLRVPVEIKINNRKLLSALAQLCGGKERMMDITMAIDKLDKIGIEKVKDELLSREVSAAQISIIEKYLNITGDNENKLREAEALFSEIEEGKEGILELRYLLELAGNKEVVIDLTLARGLNYYTGTIYEVMGIGVKIGSIGGGGRYDDLTSLFGVKDIAGVGISFGVDRIYDVMEDLNLFPPDIVKNSIVLFFNMGEKLMKNTFTVCNLLRQHGVACEIYHEALKMEKQFKYASKKGIKYVIIMGETEISDEICLVKNLITGIQEKILITELGNYFIKEDI